MIIKVFDDILSFFLLIGLDLLMTLLKLLVLMVVLASNLFILLLDYLSLLPSVLILQCLLIVELLINLTIDAGSVDLSEQRNKSLCKDLIESFASHLAGHVYCGSSAFLKVGNLAEDIPKIDERMVMRLF